MYPKFGIAVVVCLALTACVAGQTTPQAPPTTGKQPEAQSTSQATTQATTPATGPADQQAAAKDDNAQPGTRATQASGQRSLNDMKIPSGSKIYVAPMGGFENYVVAGILNKKVPVVVVADRDKADYEIRGSAETEKAGWAKMLFTGSDNSNEQASINVTEIRSGKVVFAYSVHKANSARGKQSAGEAIGKHLNEAIGKD